MNRHNKKKSVHILKMPPEIYDVKVEKLANEISVRWSPKTGIFGSSMSIRFQTEFEFLDFCGVMTEAQNIYLKEHCKNKSIEGKEKAK